MNVTLPTIGMTCLRMTHAARDSLTCQTQPWLMWMCHQKL